MPLPSRCLSPFDATSSPTLWRGGLYKPLLFSDGQLNFELQGRWTQKHLRKAEIEKKESATGLD